MDNPKFKKGDRCMFVYPDSFGEDMILDDNMVIDSEPFINKNEWVYPIVGKANPSEERFLKIYDSNKSPFK